MRKLTTALLASACLTYAGSLSNMLGSSGWLGSAVYELEAPSAIETQTHKLYYGGGIRLRTNDYSFQPFTVTPPKISAGCGGIDLVFGGFGYFNPEYLIEFGKQILQQAPAFAFKTALEVFCPSCQKIMTELENLGNLINSLQLNSCGVAAKLAESAGSWLREKVGNIDLAQGLYDSYIKAKENILQKTGLTVLEEATQKGAIKSEIVELIVQLRKSGKNPVSLVDHVLPELANKGRASSLFKEALIRQFVKNVFGDVKVYIPSNSDDDYVIEIQKPKEKLNVIEIVALDGTPKVCVINVGSSCSTIKTAYVKPIMDGIVSKILTRASLTNKELEFLAAFPFPAYKLINWASVSPGILQALSEDLATWFSYELFKLILSQVSFHYTVVLTELSGSDLVSEKDKGNIKEYEMLLTKQIREAYETALAQQKRVTDKIRNGLTLVQEFERLAAESYVKNPIYSSFIFWQTSGMLVK